jgi:hypothetical protein
MQLTATYHTVENDKLAKKKIFQFNFKDEFNV